MIELVLFGLLIGAIVAAPVGPIGTATFVHAMDGQKYPALAGMAGCIAAEMVLLAVAVFGAAQLRKHLTAPPPVVYIAVGSALVVLGLYYLTARRIPPLAGTASFLVAFKITLLSPNNLAAQMALITALGLAATLNTAAHAFGFMFGELVGLLLSWMALLSLGWRLGRSETAKKALPWLRRGVGAFIAITGIAIVARLLR
jgi:putative LysE/RhtB family amino acid efflux pump